MSVDLFEAKNYKTASHPMLFHSHVHSLCYLTLPLGTDLLTLDLGVLVDHGEAGLVARHPPDPLGHDEQHTLVLLVLDVADLENGVRKCKRQTIFLT